MARPTKEGLDYFPLDTLMDDSVELVEAKHGHIGFSVIIKLYQKIYREKGYFLEWNKCTQLLISKRINVDINTLLAIVNDCIEYGIFNADLAKIGVLTSRGIQKRFIEASARRTRIELFSDLLLVNVDSIPVIVGKNPRSVVLNVYRSTQIESKEKEKREIENEITPTPENPAPAPFSPSPQKMGIRTNDGSERIEELRKTWNSLGLPEMRRTVLSFYPNEMTECLATVSVYSNAEIEEAMHNYHQVITEPDFELQSQFQYKSFQSFIGKGVERFNANAKPFEAYKKRSPGSTSNKKGGITDMSDIAF